MLWVRLATCVRAMHTGCILACLSPEVSRIRSGDDDVYCDDEGKQALEMQRKRDTRVQKRRQLHVKCKATNLSTDVRQRVQGPKHERTVSDDLV